MQWSLYDEWSFYSKRDIFSISAGQCPEEDVQLLAALCRRLGGDGGGSGHVRWRLHHGVQRGRVQAQGGELNTLEIMKSWVQNNRMLRSSPYCWITIVSPGSLRIANGDVRTWSRGWRGCWPVYHVQRGENSCQTSFHNVFLGSNTFNICRLCWSQQRLTFFLFFRSAIQRTQATGTYGTGTSIETIWTGWNTWYTPLPISKSTTNRTLQWQKTRVVRVPFESWIWFQRPILWS